MKTAIEQFRENIARVKNLEAIYTGLIHCTTSALDLSDILRAEIVLAVSALDRFIHDIVRVGMIEELSGQRSETAAYLRFQVSMQTVVFSRSGPTEQEWLDWFDNEIIIIHCSGRTSSGTESGYEFGLFSFLSKQEFAINSSVRLFIPRSMSGRQAIMTIFIRSPKNTPGCNLSGVRNSLRKQSRNNGKIALPNSE